MTKGFFVHIFKNLGMPGVRVKERSDLTDKDHKRPADVYCASHPATWVQGLDYAAVDPTVSRGGKNKKGFTMAARKSGHNCNNEASKKLSKLKITNLKGGNKADTIILPFCVETTGGIGKHGSILLGELAKVFAPGDSKDPLIRKTRAVWKSRMVKEHAFFLAEMRSHHMDIKFDQIRVALGHKYRTNNGFHRAFSQLRKKQAGANDADLRADFCSGGDLTCRMG